MHPVQPCIQVLTLHKPVLLTGSVKAAHSKHDYAVGIMHTADGGSVTISTKVSHNLWLQLMIPVELPNSLTH